VLIAAGALAMPAPVILAALMYQELTFGYTRVTFR